MASSHMRVAVIGGGPAGLMAAEVLSQAGIKVHLYDAMPSVGRKFLLAGVGGMNITHAEPLDAFRTRYGDRVAEVSGWLDAFSPEDLRRWVHDLGIATFIGSSGRVFPADMKAAPLLRAWLRRLREAGVEIHVRHRWQGWHKDGALLFSSPLGEVRRKPDALILALGGGSWPRLGSDGRWLPLLRHQGVDVAPLEASNCGFNVPWSAVFRDKFAGQALKSVVLSFTDARGQQESRKGEIMVTADGLEGSLIYACSARLRQAIQARGHATLWLDLMPDKTQLQLQQALSRPRGTRSLSTHLQRQAGLTPLKIALLRETIPAESFTAPDHAEHGKYYKLAAAIKAVPVRLVSPRPIDEAISSAGGVRFAALDAGLMLKPLPGVFCAGEMLDWEAPTGGYLLTACFASGRAAAAGVLRYLGLPGLKRVGLRGKARKA